MMKLFRAAADVIQAAGLGVLGTDLFIGTIPAEVRQGAMLRGSMMGDPIDDGMRGAYNVQFQIIVRDWSPQAGYDRCVSICNALRLYRYANTQVSIAWMRPETVPITYPTDKDGDLETSCRINACYVELAA